MMKQIKIYRYYLIAALIIVFYKIIGAMMEAYIHPQITFYDSLLHLHVYNIIELFFIVLLCVGFIAYLHSSLKKKYIFKRIVNSINDGIMQTDIDERITYVNQRLCEMTGYAKEELIGKRSYDIPWIDQEGKEKIKKQVEERLDGISDSYYLSLKKKNGEALWLSISGSPLLDDSGRIIGSLGISTDITAMRQVEKIVRDSEKKYKAVFEQAIVGIAIIDLEGNFIQVNKHLEKITGYSQEEMCSMHLNDMNHPDDHRLCKKTFVSFTKNIKQSHESTNRCITKEGSLRYVQMNISPVKDELGNIDYFIVIARDITEKHNSLKALKELEERYRGLFEQTPVSIVLTNEKGDIIDINDYHVNHIDNGLKQKNDYIGKSILDTNVEKAGVLDAYKQLLAGKPFDLQRVFFPTTTGKDNVYLNIKGTPLFHKEKVIGAIIIHEDITEKNTYEQELQLSDDILHQIGALVVVIDKRGDVIYCSPSSKKMLGYDNNDLLGNGWWELTYTDKEYSDKIKQRTIGYANVDIPLDNIMYERNIPNNKGDCFILWHYSKGAGGLLISVGHDITELKKHERELQTEKDFSSAVLSTMPDGLDIVDEEGTILFMNATFTKMFGADAIGKKCYEVYKDNRQQCPDCPLVNGIDVNEIRAIIVSGVAGGKTFAINHSGMLLPNGNKAVLEVFRDITDLKRTEETLKVRNKELGAFIYRASHDLRTPYSSIAGIINLSKEDNNMEHASKYFELINKSAERLDQVTQQLMLFSSTMDRITEKKLIDIEGIIKQAIDNLSKKHSIKNTVFKIQCNQAQELYSDSKLLLPILQNLIDNGAKYNTKKDSEHFITISVNDKKQYIKFAISDNGNGIPDEINSEKVFEMFIRGTYQSDGAGLGLYIAKTNVEKLGGTISMESILGEGTTFTILLPKGQ